MLYFICPKPEQDKGWDKKGWENCKLKMVQMMRHKSKLGNYRGETVNPLPVRLKVTVPVTSHQKEKLTENIHKICATEFAILSSLILLTATKPESICVYGWGRRGEQY